MRNRWLVVIAVASLCLNVAVIGTYIFRTARRLHHRRMAYLAPEVREKLVKAREAAIPAFAASASRLSLPTRSCGPRCAAQARTASASNRSARSLARFTAG